MNRLWIRLTLAFIIVTQFSIFVVAALANSSINGEFRQYVIQRDVNELGVTARRLTIFYTQSGGTWTGVDKVMAWGGVNVPYSASGAAVDSQKILPDFSKFGFTSSVPVQAQPLLLADAQGKVIYDPTGTRSGTALNVAEIKTAMPVPDTTSGGKPIAYLLPNMPPVPGDVMLPSPEQTFLDRLHSALYLAALMVGVVGILIGLIISRTMVSPLATLAQAAHAFGAQDWSHRIKVRGASEIADVARAFNQMADQIQRAETLRRNLIADIAHELRTPLTVMQGNLSALLDGLYPLELTEIATLHDETSMLSRLVDDLRELARADAGKLNLKLDTVNTAQVLTTTVANFTIAAESQGVQVSLESLQNIASVRADADRMMQILRNMLVNALRHSQGGCVTVAANMLPATAKRPPMVCVSVTDNGEGIAPEDLPHVFERFYRADKSRARGSGNSGLGLAIAKAWVEAMDGKIGAESTLGKGSRFWFALPAV